MIISDTSKKYVVLVKNGQVVSGPLTEAEAIYMKVNKFPVDEHASILLVPSTVDGKVLLNE